MNKQIREGLERAAFYSPNDAIYLAMCGEEVPRLDGLDLFCISEIKKSPNGAVEIKFIDRIKALTLLNEFEREDGSSNDTISSLINALGE